MTIGRSISIGCADISCNSSSWLSASTSTFVCWGSDRRMSDRGSSASWTSSVVNSAIGGGVSRYKNPGIDTLVLQQS